MNRLKNSDPEVVILSSDSEEEESTSRKVISSQYSRKPKVSGFSKLSNMNVVPLPKEEKPNQVFKHSILVDDSGRVKVVTKVTQGFSNVNSKPADSTVNTAHESGCIRESSTSVKIVPPSAISKNKSPAPPTKVKSIEDDQLDLEAEEWLKKKRKIKTINEGANPPLPLIPLGQPSALHFHDRNRKPVNDFNSTCEMVRFEKDPSYIEKSFAGTEPEPVSITTAPSSFKLADMRDVKDLIDACKGIAKDETDRKLVENLRKKMMKISVDSVADYETTYQEFTQSIRRKVVHDPSHVHVHLKEFLDEVKSSDKSRQLAKQARDLESQPSTSGTSIWNHPANISSLPSSEKTAAKVAAIERRMKVLMMKIEELNAKEIAIDEMDDESAFARTELYEKKLMKLWTYLCKLTNRDNETSRSVDAKFRFEGSQYPEINRAVVKLVRKMKPEIPDYNDMLKIVTFCNKKYFFRIPESETINIATDILKMVVEELQRRRRDDFTDSMEVYMHFNRAKCVPLPHDPAKDDPELKAKLDESRRLGKTRTDEVLAHFAQKQEMKERENPEKAKKDRENGEDTEDDEDEEEESEREEESEYNDEDIRLLIEEDEAKGGGGGDNSVVKCEADDPRPLSDSEEDESSESSNDDGDDVDIDDDEQKSPSKKRKLSEPPDAGASGLKIISVEGGSLFYECDGSGLEKFSHFKGSAAEDSDSDVITLD